MNGTSLSREQSQTRQADRLPIRDAACSSCGLLSPAFVNSDIRRVPNHFLDRYQRHTRTSPVRRSLSRILMTQKTAVLNTKPRFCGIEMRLVVLVPYGCLAPPSFCPRKSCYAVSAATSTSMS